MSIFPFSVGKTVMPCETYVIHSLRMLTEGLGSDVSMFVCVLELCDRLLYGCIYYCCVSLSETINCKFVYFLVVCVCVVVQLLTCVTV